MTMFLSGFARSFVTASSSMRTASILIGGVVRGYVVPNISITADENVELHGKSTISASAGSSGGSFWFEYRGAQSI